jgi:PLP dependent protein
MDGGEKAVDWPHYARRIMGSLENNLQEVKQRIARAIARAGRAPQIASALDGPSAVPPVLLLAVSKTFGAEAVRQAHAAGQRAFGENYVQEALAKIEALRDLRELQDGPDPLDSPDLLAASDSSGLRASNARPLPIEWHFIGPLQSNKTRPVAENFDWVHSVERLKIAQRLAEQRPAGLAPLNVCLQVNTSGEASKAGVAPGELLALALAVAALPPERLRLRGLMAIPEPAATEAAQRAQHRPLRELFNALREQGLALDTLSMGMSADLESAIAEGSTMVRVGSAIFGSRKSPH